MLTKPNEATLANLVREIRNLEDQSLRTELTIGMKLTQARNLLGTGQFPRWVEDNFSFGLRTAYNRMKAYAGFGELDFATVAKFDLQAMVQLAGYGEDAVSEAFSEAVELKAGERFTMKRAKKITAKHPKKRAMETTAEYAEKQPAQADLQWDRAKIIGALHNDYGNDSFKRLEGACCAMETIEAFAAAMEMEIPPELREAMADVYGELQGEEMVLPGEVEKLGRFEWRYKAKSPDGIAGTVYADTQAEADELAKRKFGEVTLDYAVSTELTP